MQEYMVDQLKISPTSDFDDSLLNEVGEVVRQDHYDCIPNYKICNDSRGLGKMIGIRGLRISANSYLTSFTAQQTISPDLRRISPRCSNLRCYDIFGNF